MLLSYPRVSLVISTYDRPKMLEEALKSALAQTYRDFEVVVVEDGSEGAEKVCRDLAGTFDARGTALRLLRMSVNSGYQAAPKNLGIASSRGSYIAYLDDDNLLDEDHLETLMEEMEKGSADCVYSRWRYTGKGPGRGMDSVFVQSTAPALGGLVQSPMLNYVDSSSMLHSKSAFAANLGAKVWNEEVRRFGDWELVRRAAQAGLRFRGVDKVTFTYRWHGENLQLTRSPNELSTVSRKGTVAWEGKESVLK